MAIVPQRGSLVYKTLVVRRTATSSTMGAAPTESVVCESAFVIGSSASGGPLIKVGVAHSGESSLHQTLSLVTIESELRPSDFCAWAVESGACSNCFSGPIIPLRCNLRRVLLNGNSGCFVDLTWFQENNYGCPKAEQDAGNAKHGDRQQPQLTSKEVTSAHTNKKSDRDKRNNPWSEPFPG